MALTKKGVKLCKYGLNGSKKKLNVNFWRFIFNGIEKNTGAESTFFIEFQMINPWVSPAEVQLGFKPRVSITADDLQYALAGTKSALELKAESLVVPSYAVIRIGRVDDDPKQLCSYICLKDLKINSKKFEISIGNKSFSMDLLTGFVNLTEKEKQIHPEYLCDCGYATWNLKYEVVKEVLEGYSGKTESWFPCGLKTNLTGIVNFDGKDYLVEPRKSFGYMERFWGKTFPANWFHISSANLTSLISGKFLFDSTFAIQGDFEEKIAFCGTFEGTDIMFNADDPKHDTVFNCVQAPEADEDGNKLLHWSVSINSKIWVIDIDIFCKIKDLYNRNIEMPEGERKTLNVLQGAMGTGEIKLYKRAGLSLEQIEFAKIEHAFCEFGQLEEAEN
ncbi:MAG: hypothetical protein MJ162_03495 [Treponema sp.]|nr:hypothetical protein [Treponema sp.]